MRIGSLTASSRADWKGGRWVTLGIAVVVRNPNHKTDAPPLVVAVFVVVVVGVVADEAVGCLFYWVDGRNGRYGDQVVLTVHHVGGRGRYICCSE